MVGLRTIKPWTAHLRDGCLGAGTARCSGSGRQSAARESASIHVCFPTARLPALGRFRLFVAAASWRSSNSRRCNSVATRMSTAKHRGPNAPLASRNFRSTLAAVVAGVAL